ncbi:prothymosin alpha-B-like [Tripterygium wilfordii]|uniref:prothymosin alpha-B-like n=1 Tax=Tripterygium wilfordii TaxID=458696 RepID=UPI0018F7FEE1|nr:prothymosin alpha-B-like [Tripterygium wilfordii]
MEERVARMNAELHEQLLDQRHTIVTLEQRLESQDQRMIEQEKKMLAQSQMMQNICAQFAMQTPGVGPVENRDNNDDAVDDDEDDAEDDDDEDEDEDKNEILG